jgi:2-polyprenyl-6-methoxyphenol hydroxylase-like FAD-dependent oxidoreductase
VHYRLNRKKFRQLLSTDIPVKWSKRFTHFETVPDGVLVHFSDGSVVKGSMLLGIEGKNSRVKRLLVGEENAKLNPLPVAFVGISLRLSPERMAPFKAIHPVLWQGSHPGSGYFLFFSMLSTPESNGSEGTGEEFYEGQFNMSWLVEKNGPTPATGPEQIAKVKEAAASDTGFFPGLKEAVLDIPEDSPVLEIKLEDWPTQMWPNAGGRVQLVGDAAHTMTMCMSFPSHLPLHPSFYAISTLTHHRPWRSRQPRHIRRRTFNRATYPMARRETDARRGLRLVSERGIRADARRRDSEPLCMSGGA